MGRKRIHANDAARMRAHRSRIALLDRVPQPKLPKATCPLDVTEIEKEIRAVQAEFEAWLLSLPDSIKGTVRADLIQEAIGLLSVAADELTPHRPNP